MAYNAIGGVFMYYVLFNSITMATRVRNHFKYEGVTLSMTHTPKEISKGGCSYSLIVKPVYLNNVLAIADDYGITVKGVYQQTESGFIKV